MAGVVDTNILLYAANSEAPEQSPARQFLLDAGRSSRQWYLTDGTLYEFLRVSTHSRVFPKPLTWRQSLDFLTPFIDSPRFSILGTGEGHWSWLEEVLQTLSQPAGNLFFDIRTVSLMREHGIREIYTADTDFFQFPHISVVNPISDR